MSASTAYAATTPGVPRNFKAGAGDQQVTLTWSAPTTGIPSTGYQITYTPGSGRISTTDTSYPVTGLTNGTAYSFAIRAYQGSVYGPAARATATPHASPPTPPNNLGATQIGPGQIRLDWTPPTSSGSAPAGQPSPNIDHYNITISPGGTSTQVPPSTLTYTASGLNDSVTYTFSVSATNTRPLTGKPAIVYAPLPTGATIGLQPTAGQSSTAITVTGQLFLKNESITLYWDLSTRVAGSVVADDNGSFTKVVKPRANDKPGVHRLCVNVQPKPCANFTLQPKPTPGAPTPLESPSPSPSPSGNPQASGARPSGGGGISGLDILTRPPFVFLPIIGILGLLGVLIYWFLSSRRRPMAPGSASVVHHATRPDYMEPFPSTPPPPVVPPLAAPLPNQAPAPASPPPVVPPVQPDPSAAWPLAAAPPAPAPPSATPPPDSPTWGTAPPGAPPPPVQRPSAWPPEKPPAPVEAPPPPAWPAAPDEPPDLPQPSD